MSLQSFNDYFLPKKVERSCLGPRTTGAYFIFSYRSEKDHFLKCINIIKPRYFNKLPHFWWHFQHFGGPLADPLDLAAPLKSFADHLGVRGPQVENHWSNPIRRCTQALWYSHIRLFLVLYFIQFKTQLALYRIQSKAWIYWIIVGGCLTWRLRSLNNRLAVFLLRFQLRILFSIYLLYCAIFFFFFGGGCLYVNIST